MKKLLVSLMLLASFAVQAGEDVGFFERVVGGTGAVVGRTADYATLQHVHCHGKRCAKNCTCNNCTHENCPCGANKTVDGNLD